MSHTKVTCTEDYYAINRPPYCCNYHGHLEVGGWTVVRVTEGRQERLASHQSKMTAMRIALMLTAVDCIREGVIEAVSPEDRVGYRSRSLRLCGVPE